MSIVQTQTTSFKKELYEAVHNLSTDTLKIALYTGNATLNEDTTVYSATNEVVASGYTAGGNTRSAVEYARARSFFLHADHCQADRRAVRAYKNIDLTR
jgi:hypothetical protein